MRKSHIIKAVCAVSLTAACVWSLAGCADASKVEGGVAGTVNGIEISEQEITDYIQGVRDQLGATDEEAWGSWLAQNKYTPESVREEVFNSFVQRELINVGADEKGITIDSAEIDDNVNKMKQNYDTDEKWQAALDQVGLTEETYRKEIELQLKQNKLFESFVYDEEPDEADLLQYAQMYASSYDGAKRSSHILFEIGDEENAQDVLNQINSGQIDFVDAVKKYSKDTASAEQDGDVGWDKGSSLVQEYVDGLAPLEKGQVSELVTTQFGIHIIKCTDVFVAPKEVTSMDQIPAEWVDAITTTLKQQKQQESYQAWLQEMQDKADIKMNDMPKDLPYYVDMSKFEAQAPDASPEQQSSDPAAQAAETGDNAASDGNGAEASNVSVETKTEAGTDTDKTSEGAGNAAESSAN